MNPKQENTLHPLISSLVWAAVVAFAINTCHQDAPAVAKALGVAVSDTFVTVVNPR